MRKSIPLLMLCIGIALLFSTLPVQAATTEVHVVKYASDKITILNETTVTYQWIEENLRVCGDEITHYFHQGPVFGDEGNETHPGEPYDPWNPHEDVNVESRDFGAVKGTDIKDLCELIGGMSPGDEIMIHASDGFRKYFDYSNVYEPQPRQGPLVLTWWHAEDGYVPEYSSGMRLIFFADTSTNPWGWHVFGNWDMHECLATDYWHNYSAFCPSTSGLSVKCVDKIAIHSSIEPPEIRSIEVFPSDVTLDEDGTQQFNVTAYDEEGNEMLNNIGFSWTSSNENVGTVDDTGLFEAKNAGTTTITAENGTITGTANVTVHDNEDSGDWWDSGDSGGDAQSSPVLTAINEMEGAVFNWTSSNETVGTINNTGLFMAIASGTTTINATNVTVFTPTPTPISITTPALFLVPTVEPTTIVRVIKCAGNGSVLDETTHSYQWLDANLPVYGDGIIHYYHQGPVFEGDKWDKNETKNLKDKGAVKGTNIADLCDLVGGMSPDDDVMIHAQDGYHLEFNYTNIYKPDPRQGPLVLTWCHSGDGYVPDYWSGMQLVFFADDHVFGNWDMHECLPEAAQHFYELYPSTNGLSVKWIDEIRIYAGGYTGDVGGPAKSMPRPRPSPIPGFEIIFAIAGLLLVVYALWRRR